MKLVRKDEMEKPVLRFVNHFLFFAFGLDIFVVLSCPFKWLIIQVTKLKHRRFHSFFFFQYSKGNFHLILSVQILFVPDHQTLLLDRRIFFSKVYI